MPNSAVCAITANDERRRELNPFALPLYGRSLHSRLAQPLKRRLFHTQPHRLLRPSSSTSSRSVSSWGTMATNR